MKNKPSEVIIDGVKYVPIKDVYPANARAIKLALIDYFWGYCSHDSDEELDKKWTGLGIKVYDDGDCETTIDDVLALVEFYSRDGGKDLP